MSRSIRKYLLPAALALLGAGAGFAYYRFVGCATGACPIASSPYLTVLLGALLGVSLAPSVKREKRREQNNG